MDFTHSERICWIYWVKRHFGLLADNKSVAQVVKTATKAIINELLHKDIVYTLFSITYQCHLLAKTDTQTITFKPFSQI